jgi:hypothetical protein
MRIACLHTAASNIAVFDAAAATLGVSLAHETRSDLLAAAEQAGGPTPAILSATAELLTVLAKEPGTDAVLLTCSTIGPAAALAEDAACPVLRVDAALADAASRLPGRVTVLCAAPTTIEPTRTLFEAAFGEDRGRLHIELVEDAWPAFRAGDQARYLRLIAAAADAVLAAGHQVALAQASMAGAAPLCRGGAPLTSPGAGLAAIAVGANAPKA